MCWQEFGDMHDMTRYILVFPKTVTDTIYQNFLKDSDFGKRLNTNAAFTWNV